MPSGKQNLKIGTPFGTLGSQVEKLARPSYVGTFIGLLARSHVKMRSWFIFGMLVRGNVEHAGTHGMRFSKLADRFSAYTGMLLWKY